MRPIRTFFGELMRRRVVRLLGAYIAVFWLVAEGLSSLFPALGAPSWALRAFVITGIAAIPLLAWMSWKYDIVPPRLLPDREDSAIGNPGRSWAMLRHDAQDAGYLLIKWSVDGQSTKEQRFFKPVTIGREPNNDIELTDERVSRHHAVLFAEDGAWCVRDLESANGTFVNHSRVAGSVPLPAQCELRLHASGPTISVFVSKAAETLAS